MAMKEISERAAQALGGAQAVITGYGPARGPVKIQIIWNDRLIQRDYRMGDMGCPAPIPDMETAIKYLEQHAEHGFFVVLRNLSHLKGDPILNGEPQVLNDPSLRLEYEEDNRDLTETWLRVKGSDKLLVVDPVELFRSALTNGGMSETEASQFIDDINFRIDQINGEKS